MRGLLTIGGDVAGLRNTLASAEIGVAFLDGDGTFRVVNPALCEMLDYSADELSLMQLWEVVHPIESHREERLFREVLSGVRQQAQSECRLLRKGGQPRWARSTIYLDGPAGAVLLLEDVSEQKQAEEVLHRLAVTDDLTGLLNRRGFSLLGEREWRIARRKQRPFLLLFIDVDNLKRINDDHGHAAGDAALVRTARVLRGICRDTDILARWSGDEFVLLAAEAEDDSEDGFRERLERGLRNSEVGWPHPFALTLSVGAAQYDPRQPLSLDELLVEADRAMYERKRDKPSLRILSPQPQAEPPVEPQPEPEAEPARAERATRPPAASSVALQAALAEVERLRAALHEIVSEGCSDARARKRAARMQRLAVDALNGTSTAE